MLILQFMPNYKRNFLDKVIWRLDFEKIDLKLLEEFKKQIVQEFPNEKKIVNKQVSVTIDAVARNSKQTEEDVTSFQYSHKNEHKRLVIGSNYCFIEFDRYKNSQELFKDVEMVSEGLETTFNLKTVSRCGLRFVNNIKLSEITKGFKYDDYFSPNLLGSIKLQKKLIPKKQVLARTMSELALNLGNHILQYRFGIFNTDFPAVNVKREFIIDLDCYSTLAFDIKESSLVELIRNYNNLIEKAFEVSITDKLRLLLNKLN